MYQMLLYIQWKQKQNRTCQEGFNCQVHVNHLDGFFLLLLFLLLINWNFSTAFNYWISAKYIRVIVWLLNFPAIFNFKHIWIGIVKLDNMTIRCQRHIKICEVTANLSKWQKKMSKWQQKLDKKTKMVKVAANMSKRQEKMSKWQKICQRDTKSCRSDSKNWQKE